MMELPHTKRLPHKMKLFHQKMMLVEMLKRMIQPHKISLSKIMWQDETARLPHKIRLAKMMWQDKDSRKS